MSDDKPTIGVYVHTDITDEAIADIRYGIEEEGVPDRVVRLEQLNPLELAHEAALSSRLGVGIGISLEYAVITTEKLPSGKPYMATILNGDPLHDRAVGINAARLVKRVPLIPLDKPTNQSKEY